MTEKGELGQERDDSRFSQAINQDVHPMAVVAASVFILGFLTLVIVAQQFPEHWFVQKYLAGYRLFVAIIVLLGIVMAILAATEHRMLKRKREGQQDSDAN